MGSDTGHRGLLGRSPAIGLRYGWPVLLVLGILWFPFDWLGEVWPAFAVPFHEVFRSARDHFIGHTIFFFLVGIIILGLVPFLRQRLSWYVAGLVASALIQETIQAIFRRELPTFTDFNAFKGDALGGLSAWVLCFVLSLGYIHWKRMGEKAL